MAQHNRKSAVVVIGFNRPDLLSIALKSIPQDGRSIYISIDGARSLDEEFAVNQSTVIAENYQSLASKNSVQVRKSMVNQGCKYGVFNAIEWAFQREDSLIILEDDINPQTSFYDFCDQGLSIFADNQSIWQLNGWTPRNELENSLISFYQTRHAHIWGWATWKSRWQKFDLELDNWRSQDFSEFPIFKGVDLHKNFNSYWNRTLKACAEGEIDTWDSQWLYSMWLNGSYAISPSSRLCGNIGFDSRATHTPTSGGDLFSKMPESNIFFLTKDLVNFNCTLEFDAIHDLECYKLDSLLDMASSPNSLQVLKHNLKKVIRRLRELAESS